VKVTEEVRSKVHYIIEEIKIKVDFDLSFSLHKAPPPTGTVFFRKEDMLC